MRRSPLASLLAAALLAFALLPGSTGAADNGVEAAVGRVLTLAVKRVSATGVEATLTTTIAPTRVTVSRAGSATPIRSASYSLPVTRAHLSARVDPGGRPSLLVTAGPQTP